jgi:hypothetical protein
MNLKKKVGATSFFAIGAILLIMLDNWWIYFIAELKFSDNSQNFYDGMYFLSDSLHIVVYYKHVRT